jgi:hypothetical protein
VLHAETERELNGFGSGLTEMEVRLQFQQEEEEEAKRGLPAKHKVTPSAFMTECLALEEDQYVFLFYWKI